MIQGKKSESRGRGEHVPSPEAMAALQALRRKFAEKLPGKIADLRRAFEKVQAEEANTVSGRDALIEMHRLAHNLHGSGASFGMAGISKQAGRLELLLQEGLNGAPDPAARGRIAHCLRDLEQISAGGEFFADAGGTGGESHFPAAGTAAAPESAPEQKPRTSSAGTQAAHPHALSVFILDRKGLLGSSAGELGYFGVRAESFQAGDSLFARLKQETPSAVIMDEIAERNPDALPEQLPVMFVGEGDDVLTRLKALRAGVDAFFAAPAGIMDLLSTLDGLVDEEANEPYRVLIVDDETESAESTALILRGDGMLTEVVSDPLQVLDTLRAFEPDLILMDVYMPHCDGRELAGVIRQLERFVSVPIVYLSTETSTTRQLDAVGRGADDFLTKPIEPRHLIASVHHRAKRSRLLRSFMLRDGLTGLLNHTAFKDRLDLELQRARETDKPLSLVILDIDYFKSVNDTHGHAAGDKVLKCLARMLRARDGIAGRYGGEEFALMLPGRNAGEAEEIMHRVRESFGRIMHRAGSSEFPVSFSCGIADTEDAATPGELIEITDRALYQAKRDGRDRIRRTKSKS